jgi:glyoxylase-like metal-dependent hydrolase (beta-lactamase superfamily II)
MGGIVWQALAVPGHDMEALAYYSPDERILISGDAFWENGFGVIFPELLGEADGMASTAATLEMLSRLPIDTVIPGHGRPFGERRCRLRARLPAPQPVPRQHRPTGLACDQGHRLVRDAGKTTDCPGRVPAFVLGLPFAVDVNARFLNLSEDRLVAGVERELLLVSALRLEDGMLRRRLIRPAASGEPDAPNSWRPGSAVRR